MSTSYLPLASFVKEKGHIASFRRIAATIGPQSATANALAEYDRRRASGEDVDIVRYGASLIVVGS